MVPFNGAILWHVCTRHKVQYLKTRSEVTAASECKQMMQSLFYRL